MGPKLQTIPDRFDCQDTTGIVKCEKRYAYRFFNMIVRILAHNEPKRLSLAKRKITKHYMDLCFCVSLLFKNIVITCMILS